MSEPGGIDGRLQVPGERFHERAQSLGRQLLGTNLDEEVGSFTHCLPPTDSTIGKPSASRLA